MKKIISFISVVSMVAITMLVLPANVGAVPVEDATLVSPQTYDLHAPADVTSTVTVTLNSATTITSVTKNTIPLTSSDYTFSDNTLTITQAYLAGLSLAKDDTITLTVSFNLGAPADLIINVIDSTPPAPVIVVSGGSGLVSGSGGLTSYTPPSSGTLPPAQSSGNGTIPSFPNTGGDTLLPPPPAPAVLGAETFKFTEWMSITRGSHASEVPQLQQRLTTEGDYTGAIDGIFGKLTKASVKAYQSAHPPLKVDGIVGPLTRAVLNK